MQLIGPSNLVYLYRKKDNKKIYIFYDIHGMEESCSDNNNKDITYWLKKEFSKINEKIDLYVETPILYKESDYKAMKTLDKIRQFINNDKCPKNFRCHSIDIRDQFINIFSLFKLSRLYTINFNFLREIPCDGYTWDYRWKEMKKINFYFIDLYRSLLNDLYNKTIKPINIIKESNLLYNLKLKKQYNKLNEYDKSEYKYLHKEFKRLLKDFKNINDKFLKSLESNISNNNRKNINEKMYKENDKFSEDNKLPDRFNSIEQSINFLINITAKLLDIYTIGRILQPYTKNIIIYVGADHAKNIVKKLTNEFNFKIIKKDEEINYPKWTKINKSKTCINMDKFVPLWNIK
tara:strand:- start:1098 stop:2141 length:1044 start_codon:yes stop_codon:yes gene_type:complete